MPQQTPPDRRRPSALGARPASATSQPATQATADSASVQDPTATPNAPTPNASAQAAAKTATAGESKIRLTAFFALVLIVTYLITGFGVFPLILLADFGLRAFNKAPYSPLAFLAGKTATALKLPAKPVYMPPKRFAARVGFAFCLAITVLHYIDMEISATLLGFLIGAFAALESDRKSVV